MLTDDAHLDALSSADPNAMRARAQRAIDDVLDRLRLRGRPTHALSRAVVGETDLCRVFRGSLGELVRRTRAKNQPGQREGLWDEAQPLNE